jgi:hypothetical protein
LLIWTIVQTSKLMKTSKNIIKFKKQQIYIKKHKKFHKIIFFHTNFEVAHSAHSGPFAQNTLRLFIYSWGPTISATLDWNPRVAPKVVPLLIISQPHADYSRKNLKRKTYRLKNMRWVWLWRIRPPSSQSRNGRGVVL